MKINFKDTLKFNDLNVISSFYRVTLKKNLFAMKLCIEIIKKNIIDYYMICRTCFSAQT